VGVGGRGEDPRTLGALFYACSEEQKDLSLAEALRRLLSLALAKAREAGIIAGLLSRICG
jgi:hypothetical protein